MSEQQRPPLAASLSAGVPRRAQLVRLDPREVDPAWPAPGGDADDRPRLPGVARAGIVVLVLAVLIGGVWALGGFKARTDYRIVVQPGQMIESGPYEFTFTHATAQQVKGFDDELSWHVVAHGTVRLNGDESMSPRTGGGGMFLAKDPNTVETEVSDSAEIGPAGSSETASVLTPGLPPVPYRVEFSFSEYYEPADRIQFGVAKLEYGDAVILQTGEKAWNPTEHVFIYDNLPLKVLPPETD